MPSELAASTIPIPVDRRFGDAQAKLIVDASASSAARSSFAGRATKALNTRRRPVAVSERCTSCRWCAKVLGAAVPAGTGRTTTCSPTRSPAVRSTKTSGREFWPRPLDALNIRKRKIYATRHTFISVALTAGVNIKWLAEQCGNSVAMIEKHYGRFLAGEAEAQLKLLDPSIGSDDGQPVLPRVVENCEPGSPGSQFPPKNP
ncbi:MAG: hypothetical protein SF182_14195 [Deltaproteobacteria bacterium]|nr:hypothetical protein [Deltaproteobacteria bacterium]